MPFDVKTIRAYVTWALSEKNLKSSTVESYLSSIATAHSLANENCVNFCKDRSIQMLLKGGENLSLLSGSKRPYRISMNINLLKILGHRIAMEEWDVLSKQVIWTASVVFLYLMPDGRNSLI